MKSKISKIDILSVDIPFKNAFRHTLKKRESSESVFVKIETENHAVGFGESLPRDYVTGENQRGVMNALSEFIPKNVLNRQFDSFNDVISFCDSLDSINGAVKCALELSLLDAFGREFHNSLFDALKKGDKQSVRYGVGIGSDSPLACGVKALIYRLYGFNNIKLKVGDSDDVERLRFVRASCGRGMKIRLDANCAWSAQEAIAKLNIMKGFGFNLIEQPVQRDDMASLKKVSDALHEPVMADESLCTIDDAKKLVSNKACDMFNIRISKCGGILNSVKIAQYSEANNIPYQIGCQVGESGVLSAAGRHFAFSAKPLYIEGSYSKYLLKEDVVTEDIAFKFGGIAKPISGYGLGVNVDENVLNKYVTDRITIN